MNEYCVEESDMFDKFAIENTNNAFKNKTQ